MSGRRSRMKGRRFEQALVHRFAEAMPDVEIRRGLQSRSGAEVSDVEVPCLWVECKHHQRTNVRAALEQAIRTAPQGRWPLAICKDDRKPALVAMELDDFLEMLSQWWRRRS